MKTNRMMVLLLTTAFAVLSCAHKPDLEQIRERFDSTEAKHYENYSFDPSVSVVNRIAVPDAMVLDYLNNMDGRDDYKAYVPTEEERMMFAEYYELLPTLNQKIMEEKLIAIYFVQDLYGSALADYVLSREEELYNILIINPETMKNSMTDWLSYRENSAYIQEEGSSLKVDCGEEYSGLFYVLLHESAHLVDYSRNISPYPEYTSFILRDQKVDENNPFFDVWKTQRQPRRKYQEAFMAEYDFYGLGGGPYLEADRAEEILNYMKDSPFTSLYSTMSWAEDLAEMLTWYHWTEIMDQPYVLEYEKEGQAAIRVEPMKSQGVIPRNKIVRVFYE